MTSFVLHIGVLLTFVSIFIINAISKQKKSRKSKETTTLIKEDKDESKENGKQKKSRKSNKKTTLFNEDKHEPKDNDNRKESNKPNGETKLLSENKNVRNSDLEWKPDSPSWRITKTTQTIFTTPSLTNIRATSYFNATLQALSSCDQFVRDITKLHEKYNHKLKKLSTFHDLISILNGRNVINMGISNNDIFQIWNKSGREDSFELLAYVINEVYNELREYEEDIHDIPIRNLVPLPMRIIIDYEIRCGCGVHTKVPPQAELALHVPIPSKEKTNLQNLVDRIFIKDHIDGYECDSIGCDGQNAFRHTKLRKPLPTTLCVHLQRTFWNGRKMVKIDTKIDFGTKLTIKSGFCSVKTDSPITVNLKNNEESHKGDSNGSQLSVKDYPVPLPDNGNNDINEFVTEIENMPLFENFNEPFTGIDDNKDLRNNNREALINVTTNNSPKILNYTMLPCNDQEFKETVSINIPSNDGKSFANVSTNACTEILYNTMLTNNDQKSIKTFETSASIEVLNNTNIPSNDLKSLKTFVRKPSKEILVKSFSSNNDLDALATISTDNLTFILDDEVNISSNNQESQEILETYVPSYLLDNTNTPTNDEESLATATSNVFTVTNNDENSFASVNRYCSADIFHNKNIPNNDEDSLATATTNVYTDILSYTMYANNDQKSIETVETSSSNEVLNSTNIPSNDGKSLANVSTNSGTEILYNTMLTNNDQKSIETFETSASNEVLNNTNIPSNDLKLLKTFVRNPSKEMLVKSFSSNDELDSLETIGTGSWTLILNDDVNISRNNQESQEILETYVSSYILDNTNTPINDEESSATSTRNIYTDVLSYTMCTNNDQKSFENDSADKFNDTNISSLNSNQNNVLLKPCFEYIRDSVKEDIYTPTPYQLVGSSTTDIDLNIFSNNNSETIEEISDEDFILASVIVHFGPVHGGHYICYKRINNKWFLTNDSHMEPVPEAAVLNCIAYILFYEKQ